MAYLGLNSARPLKNSLQTFPNRFSQANESYYIHHHVVNSVQIFNSLCLGSALLFMFICPSAAAAANAHTIHKGQIHRKTKPNAVAALLPRLTFVHATKTTASSWSRICAHLWARLPADALESMVAPRTRSVTQTFEFWWEELRQTEKGVTFMCVCGSHQPLVS